METPEINIGIVKGESIFFSFNGEYILAETGALITGEQKVSVNNGKILFNGKWHDELFFEPTGDDVSFDLMDVTIGIDFHWERKENQRFKGALNLIVDGESIVAINQIDIESYLSSVISSEMNSDAPGEFLKAHAVISRSWVMSQIRKSLRRHEDSKGEGQVETENRRIKWYDREDHKLFDVCADDHCQRYQGISRKTNPQIEKIIDKTYGEVLMYDGEICDARFSKCCGGAIEEFDACWEDISVPYLKSAGDNQYDLLIEDLTKEEDAEKWIRSSPKAFCNTHDKQLLQKILNNYDCETPDFYRWKVSYSQETLSKLIEKRTGIDFGNIIDLVPLKRGKSGRIYELMIKGSKRNMVIGKELEIRRSLSESHLYSSAFVVDKVMGKNGVPEEFTLTGSGWGHGVGLCQIGAAVMSTEGYTYKEILKHYFPGSVLEKIYEKEK